MRTTAAITALVLLAVLTLVAVLPVFDTTGTPPPTPVRERLLESGTRETGAVNLVTAIYLGYRLYDTLGEAIVLLLAVSAALFFLEADE